jgi:hypothetical protein
VEWRVGFFQIANGGEKRQIFTAKGGRGTQSKLFQPLHGNRGHDIQHCRWRQEIMAKSWFQPQMRARKDHQMSSHGRELLQAQFAFHRKYLTLYVA